MNGARYTYISCTLYAKSRARNPIPPGRRPDTGVHPLARYGSGVGRCLKQEPDGCVHCSVCASTVGRDTIWKRDEQVVRVCHHGVSGARVTTGPDGTRLGERRDAERGCRRTRCVPARRGSRRGLQWNENDLSRGGERVFNGRRHGVASQPHGLRQACVELGSIGALNARVKGPVGAHVYCESMQM